MQTLAEIRMLLDQRGLRPKHRLGQNFLHDKNQIRKLVEAAEISAGELVLEVGPGTGTLTGELLERGAMVVACELDAGMAGIIAELFHGPIQQGALTLIHGDAMERERRLNADVVRLLSNRPFKLVANLPYQIASPLMSTLLIDHPLCVGQFVTIQKEVADRLLAQPGSKEFGPLTIIIQAFASLRKIGTLSPSCFWPQPDVTSAMVAITPIASGISQVERREFARFIVDLFSKRRKQLGAILGRNRTTWPSGVTPDLRPEALTVQQLISLWQSTAESRP